jgi:hypothetical protein
LVITAARQWNTRMEYKTVENANAGPGCEKILFCVKSQNSLGLGFFFMEYLRGI